jgi:hypothetical protein
MAKMTFDVEVYCDCGDELTARESGYGTLEAQPCESCMDKRYDEGFREGEATAEGD